jgi:hypothetical protein
MPIETSFRFNQKHAGPAPHAFGAREAAADEAAAVDFLGLLRGLVGNEPAGNPQRTWKGTGFNQIWRPNFGNLSGSQTHFLQLNMTSETLSFTDVSGPTGIANRGLLQADIFLGGVAYLQSINDSFDDTGQHFEPGVFNTVPLTTNPDEPETITRMGTIPHGTTINMQGRVFTAPQPLIQPTTITPFRIGSPDDGATGLIPFPEEDLEQILDSRTDLARVAGLTQARLTNPNLFLTDVLQTQTITNTTVLILSSDTSAAGSVPDVGGGVDNIAFLIGKGTPPTGGPNANVPKVTCIFWIEEGTDASGNPLLQLQYTQRVLLDFNGLSWPHITVATLTPVVAGAYSGA